MSFERVRKRAGYWLECFVLALVLIAMLVEGLVLKIFGRDDDY